MTMNDPWEAAKTATVLVGFGVVVALGLAVLVGLAAVIGMLAQRVKTWRGAAASLGSIVALLWLVVFVATLFFGTPR